MFGWLRVGYKILYVCLFDFDIDIEMKLFLKQVFGG